MRLRLERWLFGLPILAAIWGVSVWRLAPEIEVRLRAEVQEATASEGANRLRRAGARVEVEGRDLAVTAEAPLSAESQAEVDRVRSTVPALRQALVRLSAPAIVEGYSFEARRSGRNIVLSGMVPPGEVRADLVDQAKSSFEGAVPKDDLTSALGAPENFEEVAKYLIRAAGALEEGRARLAGRSFSISGTAPDTSSYRAAMELARRPPAGFKAEALEVTPPTVRPYAWSATRDRDLLLLEGNVPSEGEREALVKLATELARGARVEDRMDTARGLDRAVDFDAIARKGLAVVSRLDRGRVALTDRAVTVEGAMAARDLLPAVEAELRQARLPGADLARVELRPVPAVPYTFSARRTGGRVLLAGYVPAEQDRTALRDLVRRRFPFEAVVDNLHLADGAPPGFLGVVTPALDRLATLAEGELALEDRRIRLAGRSLYAELAARTERELSREIPAGWDRKIDITAVPAQKPLDPGFCNDLLAEAARKEPVQFEAGKADLAGGARKTLDGIVRIMRRCGDAALNVMSVIEAPGDLDAARDLARRRAAAVAAALAESGLASRVLAEGTAARAPDPSKAAERISFEVRP